MSSRAFNVRLPFLLTALATLVALETACSATGTDTDEAESSESSVVGGTPTGHPAIVAIANEKDLFECSGVMIRPDTVFVPTYLCARYATAAYPGFSAPVRKDAALGQVPGAAPSKISVVPGMKAFGGVGYLVRLQAPAASWLAPATREPAVGDVCDVIGTGAPAYKAEFVGLQRVAKARVTKVASGYARATGVDGSAEAYEASAFLICDGTLNGSYAYTSDFDENPLHNEVAFDSLAYGRVADALTKALEELAASSTDGGGEGG